MNVGIIYPQSELHGDPESVRRFARAAEDRGFQHLLVYDHVLGATHDREPPLTGPYTDKHTFHDPFVMLGYVAGMTQRIELVTGVLILPQRQTALVARQAADLDLLSGERFRMGVGIGWNYVEYDALGQNFKTKGRRIAEQVGVLRDLWTKPQVDFTGEFDRMDRVTLNPRPKRSVPIWMGGFSKVVFQRAARMADGFIFAQSYDDPATSIVKMKGFLDEEGRTVGNDFGLQVNLSLGCPSDDIVPRMERWFESGGTHAAVNTMGHNFTTPDEHLAYLDTAANNLVKAGLLKAG